MKMADHGGDVPENAQDLTIFVQNLLEQMVRVYVSTVGLEDFHELRTTFARANPNVVDVLYEFSL